MRRKLPPLAIILGLGGLVPFLACGFGAVALHDPVRAARALAALLAYGAVILSFLGAVHWGFALEDRTALADGARLGGGVLPALLGWVALLAGFAGRDLIGLALLAVGFAGTIALEQRGAARGLLPPGYLGLRFVLSAVVLAVLGAVLVMRLAGLHVR
jgi:hypothetical protein